VTPKNPRKTKKRHHDHGAALASGEHHHLRSAKGSRFGRLSLPKMNRFIGLKLTQQEPIVLTKNLVGIRRSDQMEIADKEILGGVLNRVVRWAVRQGAWWDDGHKIITSVGQQID
jgi:hypothetical protein